MHESHIFKNIIKYLTREEKATRRRVKKIYVVLSEFGGLSTEHFMGHYKEAVSGTKWQELEVEINKIPYGAELAITKIEFV